VLLATGPSLVFLEAHALSAVLRIMLAVFLLHMMLERTTH